MSINAPTKPLVEISWVQANDLLKSIIAQFGENYVYHRAGKPCYYFEPDMTDQPSCIIGQILHRLGVTFEQIDAISHYNNGNSLTVRELIDDEVIKCDEKTKELFALVQSKQDVGQAWGDAYKSALEEVNDERDVLADR